MSIGLVLDGSFDFKPGTDVTAVPQVEGLERGIIEDRLSEPPDSQKWGQIDTIDSQTRPAKPTHELKIWTQI